MDQRALDKIKKCLELSKSSNENEAAIALRQMQRLMLKHKISQSDVMLSDIGESEAFAFSSKKMPSYINILLDMILNQFECDAIMSTDKKYTNSGGVKYDTNIVFIGQKANAEIAAYSFSVLQRQLISVRKEFIKLTREKTGKKLSRYKMSQKANWFCAGWVIAVTNKVQRIKPDKNTKMLIAEYRNREEIGENDLEDIGSINLNKRHIDRSAYEHGSKLGRKAVLNHGAAMHSQKKLSTGAV